jgi:hypothetical protein
VLNLIVEITTQMWPAPAADEVDKSGKDERGKRVYGKLLEHGYSARCLTFPQPELVTAEHKAVFTKDNMEMFGEIVLSKLCVDWHFKLENREESASLT